MTPIEQWLAGATKGLSAESAAQVRAEIEQHYDSACEAGDDAIAALGNPRAANRAYRKVIVICSGGPLYWLFRPTTLERARIYGYALAGRDVLLVAIVWWYGGLEIALSFGAGFF